MAVSNLKVKVPPALHHQVNFFQFKTSQNHLFLGTPIYGNLSISFYQSPSLWPTWQVDVFVAGYPCVSLSALNVCPEPFEKLKLRLEVDTMLPWVTLKGFIQRQLPWKMFVKWFRIASRMVIPDLWTFKTNGCPKPTYVLLSWRTLVNLAFPSLATVCGCYI